MSTPSTALRIYLDHNATTPLSEAALARMGALQQEAFGNPSSVHWAGQRAGAAVDEARRQVAGLVGAQPSEVVFTAGGTEADVAAIWDAVARARQHSPARRAVIVTIAADHHAILHTAAHFEALGLAEHRTVGVDRLGHADLDALGAALDGADLLCTLWANNETGTLADHDAIAARLKDSTVRWHCDAVQAAGKVPIDLGGAAAAHIDTVALAAHKLHGPKGVGALVLRGGRPFVPLLPGGAQERGRRSGTLNAPGIAAFGVAAAEARARLDGGVVERVAALRDRLQDAVFALAPDSLVNGDPDRRLPNTLHVSLALGGEWLDGEDLMLGLSQRGIAVATGAACASGSRTPSHVLRAMGRSPAQAHASVRFSLGHATTAEELDHVAAALRALLAPT